MRELPKGWAATTLGEISQGVIDQSGPDKDVGTFTYVDISAIDRDTKRIKNPQSLDVQEAPSRARQRIRTGDVLVSMTRPNLNAVALVPEALDGSIGSTGFHVLRSSFISPRWVAYRVQAQDFVSTMSLKVQGALYPAVRPKDIAGFPVDLPPRAEQDRVVDEAEKHFTRLDAATAALKRVQANLKRYRASVLKAACEGRLVPTEAELARKEGRDYEPASRGCPTGYGIKVLLDFLSATVVPSAPSLSEAAPSNFLESQSRSLPRRCRRSIAGW
jgi:type I restriction enzyme S subunit